MICYLDNSATTRPTEAVADAMRQCMLEGFYNPSALYAPAVDSEKRLTACREAIARELHADPARVVFTSGGTEADNLAIFGSMSMQRGGRVLYTAGEHPAVAAPCESLKGTFDVQQIPYDAAGVVRLDALEELLTPDTRLICVMQVNNESGAVMPLCEIAQLRDRLCPQAMLHVDGVQGFMRVPMHMERMGVDLYALSGHKIHGPKGIGVLAVRPGVRLIPQITGGGQEKGLRSGTYNSPAILGLGEAVKTLAADRKAVERMRAMKAHLWAVLSQEGGIRLNGPKPGETDSAPHILSLSFDGVRGEVMRNALEGEGVLVSTGSACASHKQKVSPTLRAMGLSQAQADGTVRVSLGAMNTMDEMDEAARHMLALYRMLRQFKRR